ncbi:MAG TPA: hypothetical protein VJ765_09670 [Chitinophagaceae bacterium]|nr:hypothetical protein [Chitinophagaceae bacterium]
MKKQIENLLLSIVLPATFAVSCNKNSESIEQQNQAIESQSEANTTTEVINIRNIPVNSVFFNECCAEDVQIFGTAHFVVSNKIIHLQVSDMTGIGLSTNYNYVGQGTSVETNVFYSNQFEGTLTFMLNMTNDNGCGFRLKATLHMTMNANGDITANVESINAKCN